MTLNQRQVYISDDFSWKTWINLPRRLNGADRSEAHRKTIFPHWELWFPDVGTGLKLQRCQRLQVPYPRREKTENPSNLQRLRRRSSPGTKVNKPVGQTRQDEDVKPEVHVQQHANAEAKHLERKAVSFSSKLLDYICSVTIATIRRAVFDNTKDADGCPSRAPAQRRPRGDGGRIKEAAKRRTKENDFKEPQQNFTPTVAEHARINSSHLQTVQVRRDGVHVHPSLCSAETSQDSVPAGHGIVSTAAGRGRS